MSETVIVLQDEGILAVTGKTGDSPKIEQVTRIDTEGYGEPVALWKEALQKYVNQYHPGSVKLVLPSSYSSGRITRIPYAKGKQLDKMAQQVLKEHFENEIADYGVIQADKKKGIILCGGGAEKEVLRQFRDIGKEIGLSIAEITIPMEGLLNVLESVKEYKNKTAIFLFFEESSVTSILYKEGSYHYSTRSRIFSERGTTNFGTEIVRSISGILQFYATTKAGEPITDIYYAGCSNDDFEVCENGIQNLGLAIHPMRDNLRINVEGGAEYALAGIGAMITGKNKEVNLLKVLASEEKESGKAQVNIRKHLMYPGITLVICLAFIVVVMIWNLRTGGQINDIEDWINDDQIQQEYQEANAVKEQSEQLASELSQVTQMKNNLATYPDLTEEKIAKIVDVGGSDMSVQIKSLDAESGVLTFNAISRQVIDIPGYISKLQKTGLFSSVDYTGYQYGNEEYSLELSCVLKGEETGGNK